MKARVKATGELIDLPRMTRVYSYKEDESMFFLKDLEILDNIQPDYWTRLEHQAAIAAMHGLCANYTEFTKDNDGTLSNTEMITENARIIAHALVEKYKKEEK